MSRMAESHDFTPQDERERKDDLRKQKERGEEFKHRLKSIQRSAIENGVGKDVMKAWMREMEATFMRKGEAVWELYHDEGWEISEEMLTEMERNLEHGVSITEVRRNVKSILTKYQAQTLLELIEGLYRDDHHTSPASSSPVKRHSSSTSHGFVEKESHDDSDDDLRNPDPQAWFGSPWLPGAREGLMEQRNSGRDRRPRIRQPVTRKF